MNGTATGRLGRNLHTRVLSTRGGTIAVGAAAAVLAGVVLLIYLNQYRSSVVGVEVPVQVLVASRLIEQGTPGDAIGMQKLFEIVKTPEEHVKLGAITDASALRGQVAIADIYPGQQLTAANFSVEAAAAIGSRLVAEQRAIAIPTDSSRGMLGLVHPGDRLDVYVLLGLGGGDSNRGLKLIMQDVYVISAGAGTSGNLILRVTPGQSAKLAYASETARLWFVLRPRTGSRRSPSTLVTADALLRSR